MVDDHCYEEVVLGKVQETLRMTEVKRKIVVTGQIHRMVLKMSTVEQERR